ncbi:hypothetical protein [Sphingosinicella sp.]|uniref:hypothetical protein n=1 Tax=Sphingosinicella sp. TaxID=1917971 RepID=UPI00403830AC
MRLIFKFAALAYLCVGSAASAQGTAREPGSTGERVERIATEPARDVGLRRATIPSVLESARAGPYSLAGTRNCAGIVRELRDFDGALGRDFDAPSERQGSRAGRIAEAGGRAVVNTIIPFRGVVRELSGSAEADRRMQAAVDAGLARRGFLRGLAQARGCRR